MEKWNWQKIGATAILSTMLTGVIAWAGTQLVKVPSHEIKIKNLEISDQDQKKMIHDLHWYFIKRKGIAPPKGK